MLLIATLALWFAWASELSRSVITVDLAAPDLIAVGDRPHSLESLERYVKRSHFNQAVVRCDTNVPADSVMKTVRAIETAGVYRFRFTETSVKVNPAMRPTTHEADPFKAER